MSVLVDCVDLQYSARMVELVRTETQISSHVIVKMDTQEHSVKLNQSAMLLKVEVSKASVYEPCGFIQFARLEYFKSFFNSVFE